MVPKKQIQTSKKELGKLGEDLAKKLLLKKGYIYVCRNFNSRYGEIDLVFLDKITLVCVEVKTRVGNLFGPPEEAITTNKIRHLIKAIEYFQLKNPNLPASCRLDAVCVQFSQNLKLKSIKHYQNITI